MLADVSAQMPAYAREVFGPVAPVIRFATADDAAKLAADSEYGLSLGILTRTSCGAWTWPGRSDRDRAHQRADGGRRAERPFGGLGVSGTGARFGGAANLDAFTETRWVTIRGDIAPTPSSRWPA